MVYAKSFARWRVRTLTRNAEAKSKACLLGYTARMCHKPPERSHRWTELLQRNKNPGRLVHVDPINDGGDPGATGHSQRGGSFTERWAYKRATARSVIELV